MGRSACGVILAPSAFAGVLKINNRRLVDSLGMHVNFATKESNSTHGCYPTQPLCVGAIEPVPDCPHFYQGPHKGT